MELTKFLRWLYGDFLQPQFLMAAAAVVGIVGGISSMTGGGAEGPSAPWSPGGMGEADDAWTQANRNNYFWSDQLAKWAQPTYSRLYDRGMQANWDPYMFASIDAGKMQTDLAPRATQYGNQFDALGNRASTQAGNMFDAGNAMWAAAQDPQNALRNRLEHQTTERARAGQTARGLASTPFGAGLESSALSNFDIDWENNMLSRMNTGIQGLNTGTMGGLQANQLAGQDYTSAMAMYGMAPQLRQQGAMTPIQAQMTMVNQRQQLADMYGSGIMKYQLAPYQAIQQAQIPYMYQGAGAQNNAANFQQRQQGFDANQQQQGAQGLMQGLNELNNAWGGSGGGGGGLGSWFGGGGGDFSGSNLNSAYANASAADWAAAFKY